LNDAYHFLGLDPTFKPKNPEKVMNQSSGWTRLAINYYAGPLSRKLTHRWPISVALDTFDICLKPWILTKSDFVFLRERYLPEKNELEALLS
jgi:hypothetical protein